MLPPSPLFLWVCVYVFLTRFLRIYIVKEVDMISHHSKQWSANKIIMSFVEAPNLFHYTYCFCACGLIA